MDAQQAVTPRVLQSSASERLPSTSRERELIVREIQDHAEMLARQSLQRDPAETRRHDVAEVSSVLSATREALRTGLGDAACTRIQSWLQACFEAGSPRRHPDALLRLAAAAVDLWQQGRAELAEHLFAAWAGTGDTYDSYPDVDPYVGLEACRRLVDGTARESGVRGAWFAPLDLPRHRPETSAPCLIAVAGLIASGKSTLARRLGFELGVPVIEADTVRSRLRQERPPRGPGAEPGEEEVYAGMLSRAAPVLRSGRAVVLDACFARRDEREAASRLARNHSVPFLLAECRLADCERERRLAQRDRRDGVPPGSWRRLADDFAARSEPVAELAPEQHLRVDGAAPVASSVARLAECLRSATPRATGEARR